MPAHADVFIIAGGHAWQRLLLVTPGSSPEAGSARQGELWLIDVSQAVDLDHPRALDFLREASRPGLQAGRAGANGVLVAG